MPQDGRPALRSTKTAVFIIFGNMLVLLFPPPPPKEKINTTLMSVWSRLNNKQHKSAEKTQIRLFTVQFWLRRNKTNKTRGIWLNYRSWYSAIIYSLIILLFIIVLFKWLQGIHVLQQTHKTAQRHLKYQRGLGTFRSMLFSEGPRLNLFSDFLEFFTTDTRITSVIQTFIHLYYNYLLRYHYLVFLTGKQTACPFASV